MKRTIDNPNHLWMIFLYNIFVVLAFTGLSIVFNRWWLVLSGLLFIMIPSVQNIGYCRICDNCGNRSPSARTYNEAIDKAVSQGWLHRNEGKDYCPECRRIMNL